MLSKERLEAYRRMTPGERLALSISLMQENLPYLFAGPKEQVDRRFAVLQRQNDERTQAIAEGLARAEARRERA